MDYSSIHSDTEHPEDSDPWASSPKATKQPTFQHPSPEVLARQSLPPPAGYGSAAGGGSGHARNSSDDQNLSQSTDETEETDVAPQDLSERLQSAGPGEEGYENTPRLQFASPTNPQAHNSRLAPPQRMGQRGPPIPQYKLQAKITGLERPGRKEAILKFDVTVCLEVLHHQLGPRQTDMPADEPASFPHNPLQRCQENARRVRQVRRVSHLRQSRSHRTRRSSSHDVRRCGHG